MTRVSDASTINALINDMLRTQQRQNDSTLQVTSGKKSQTYAGIAFDSQRLVSLETAKNINDRYMANNQTQELRLNTTQTALSSVRDQIGQMKQTVSDFQSRGVYTQESIQNLQGFAFNALKNIQAFLNTEVDGQYLFSGSKTNTEPVDLNLTSLSAFQEKYDGAVNTYPTTRDAHLAETTVSQDNQQINADYIDPSNYLTFRRDDDGNTANGGRSSIESNSSLFSDYQVGSIINVSGTANNDGDYRVDEVSSDGTKVYVSTEMLTDETLPRRLFDEAPSSGATIELPDGTKLANSDTGNLALNRDAGTITALTVGSFDDVNVGDAIQISGTSKNNGTVTVTGKSTVTSQLTDEASIATDFSFLSGTDISGETVTFNRSAGTITAGAGTPFNGLSAGDTFTVSGTASNDGDYTVQSVGGGGASITIAPKTEVLNVASSQTLQIGDGTALTSDDTHRLIFSRSGDTITAGNAIFTQADVGKAMTVDGTTRNDGTYTIDSVSSDGKTATIKAVKLADEGLNSGTSYFDYTVGTQLSIDAAGDTIQAQDLDGNADTELFRNVKAGDFFRLKGTSSGTQDGIYQVLSVDKSTGKLTLDTSPDSIRQDTLTVGTLATTADAGDTYSATIDGTKVTYTASAGDTETDIRNGLVSAINSNATLNQFAIASNGGTGSELEIQYATASTTTHTTTVDATNNGGTADNTLSLATAVDGTPSSDFTVDETVTSEGRVNVDDRDITVQTGNQMAFTSNTVALSGISGGTATGNVFDNLRAGMQFTISGTGTSNDGTYTIGSVSSDGSTVTLASGETFPSSGTFTPSAGNVASIKVYGAEGAVSADQSYYNGDNVALTHRVDADRSINVDVNASNPAFEKVIRGLSLILEGKYGSEGGLENNKERVNQAMFLLDDAIKSPSEGTPPFGQELHDDLDTIDFNMGTNQVVLNDAKTNQQDFINSADNYIGKIEDVDQITAINNLLADQRALQASYQAVSRVMSISLTDYLK